MIEIIFTYEFTHNIKGTMRCSSNTNTSKSLLKMAKGSNRRITMFDNEAHRALQTTSLASKLIIKDTILKQCLHICNQNFDKRKYYKCVQCSDMIGCLEFLL